MQRRAGDRVPCSLSLFLSFSDERRYGGGEVGALSPQEKPSAEREREGVLSSLADPCGDLRTTLEL